MFIWYESNDNVTRHYTPLSLADADAAVVCNCVCVCLCYYPNLGPATYTTLALQHSYGQCPFYIFYLATCLLDDRDWSNSPASARTGGVNVPIVEETSNSDERVARGNNVRLQNFLDRKVVSTIHSLKPACWQTFSDE